MAAIPEMDKNAPKHRSEAFYRSRILEIVGDNCTGTSISVGGDIIGIACELTGIDDPLTAIKEIVQDALNRWARIQAIEYSLAHSTNSDDRYDVLSLITKSETDNPPSLHEKQIPTNEED